MKPFMKKISRCFGGINMTWSLVCSFSVACGLVVGVLMIPSVLKDTSLQSPGVNLEFWILAALFIVLNCKKPLEAGLKTFVFFLISQPLIYLVQVPFYIDHWGIFGYYPRWFALTIACFPGGMIAWLVKKGNLLSVLIMGVADAILAVSAASYICNLPGTFPKMLLAILFTLGEMVFFTVLLFKGKLRLLSTALILALLAGGFVYEFQVNSSGIYSTAVMAQGEAPYSLVSCDDRFTVSFLDNQVIISYYPNDVQEDGESVVIYEDAGGTEYEFTLIYGEGSCSVGY